MAGRVLTQKQIDALRSALDGATDARAMVMRDLLATLDETRAQAFRDVAVALYERTPRNSDEAIDIVQELARS
jgi:hypothetical protein